MNPLPRSAEAESLAMNADDLERARSLLQEAGAIQEMASRVSGENEEDFDMLQRAARVTLRLVEQAESLLAS